MHVASSRAGCPSVGCASRVAQYDWIIAIGWGLVELPPNEPTQLDGLAPELLKEREKAFLDALARLVQDSCVPTRGADVGEIIRGLLMAAPTFDALSTTIAANIEFFDHGKIVLAQVISGNKKARATQINLPFC